ncbi:hypothetical protein Tco_0261169 [Tanacetum coccineum]
MLKRRWCRKTSEGAKVLQDGIFKIKTQKLDIDLFVVIRRPDIAEGLTRSQCHSLIFVGENLPFSFDSCGKFLDYQKETWADGITYVPKYAKPTRGSEAVVRKCEPQLSVNLDQQSPVFHQGLEGKLPILVVSTSGAPKRSKVEMEALREAKGVTKFVEVPGALLPHEATAYCWILPRDVSITPLGTIVLDEYYKVKAVSSYDPTRSRPQNALCHCKANVILYPASLQDKYRCRICLGVTITPLRDSSSSEVCPLLPKRPRSGSVHLDNTTPYQSTFIVALPAGYGICFVGPHVKTSTAGHLCQYYTFIMSKLNCSVLLVPHSQGTSVLDEVCPSIPVTTQVWALIPIVTTPLTLIKSKAGDACGLSGYYGISKGVLQVVSEPLLSHSRWWGKLIEDDDVPKGGDCVHHLANPYIGCGLVRCWVNKITFALQ